MTTYTDKEVWPYRRYTVRKDGVERVEIYTFGATGKTIHGAPANGHYKPFGYRKGDVFARSFKGLKEKLGRLPRENDNAACAE